jgi:hypothetical protein
VKKPPTNMLYANTATRHSTSSPLARTRSVRARVANDIEKIGIFDISARAGLLFQLLTTISRRQPTYTFYPVETAVPMGLGMFSERRIAELQSADLSTDYSALEDNIDVDQFDSLLEDTRQQVKVDLIAGLFGPMLAFQDGGGLSFNYFSTPIGKNVAVSVFEIRDFAKQAGRPFEAAVAMITLAQVWARLYDLDYHPETRGCPFDYCGNRVDLVHTIRKAELCPESLAAIPVNVRESVEKCLQTIREYQR